MKGGVGKTSLAVFLAQQFRLDGKPLLLIDADPNNNLTDFFLRGADPEEIAKSELRHVLLRKRNLMECVYETTFQTNIVPCTVDLHRVGHELNGDPASFLTLSKELRRHVPDSDALIDTPPSLSFEFRTSLFAADVVIVPVSFSIWTMRALRILADELSKVEEVRGRSPKLVAVPCMVTEKEVEKLAELHPEELVPGLTMTKSFIGRSGTIRNMTNSGKWFHPQSEGNKSFDQFRAVYKEIKRIVK